MSIQPLSNRPREISVTEIIEPAFERVKLVNGSGMTIGIFFGQPLQGYIMSHLCRALSKVRKLLGLRMAYCVRPHAVNHVSGAV